MSTPSKSFGIDPTGRVLFSEAADNRVASKQITVGTSATELKSDDSTILRRKLFVRNVSSAVAYIGASGVTTSGGFPLYQYDEIELDIDAAAHVYGITASGTVSVHVLEVE